MSSRNNNFLFFQSYWEIVRKYKSHLSIKYSLNHTKHKVLLQGADSKESWREEMLSALKGLLQVLQDDATVSSYELQSTGLVTALLRCLYQVTLMQRTLSYFVGHLWSKCSTLPLKGVSQQVK